MKRSKFEEILDSQFRWPTAGEAPFVSDPIPIAYADLHLPTLNHLMNGVAGLFTGTDGFLADLNRARP